MLGNDIKKDFPLLAAQPDFVYLDSGATTQTPQVVLDAMNEYYMTYRSNIHRGVYDISETASSQYEDARKTVASFLGITDSSTIVFTRGTTESINLVASGWVGHVLQPGDEVIVTELEHHSNFVPWVEICHKTGAQLRVVPVKSDMTLDMAAYESMLSQKTKLVCVSAISNVTGTINDISLITQMAHAVGAKVLVDGAQVVGHQSTNLAQLDADFFACSGHKMYGPTGIGILYAKKELLNEVMPTLYGGGMIETVSAQHVTYRAVPARLEGGTPPIAEAIGLAAAVRYIQSIGLDNVYAHERDLASYAAQTLSAIDGVTVFHQSGGAGIISFEVAGVHPHDIASICNTERVAIRAGHHCAQPLMRALDVLAIARMSLGIYNTEKDVEVLAVAIKKSKQLFV